MKRRPFQRRGALALAVSVLACAACGTSGKGKVAAAYRDFVDAYAKSDGEKACHLLTAAAQQEVARVKRAASCELAVQKNRRRLDAYRKAARRLGDSDVKFEGKRARIKTGLIALPPPPQPSVPPIGAAPVARAPSVGPRTAVLEKEGGNWKVRYTPFLDIAPP